MINNSRKKWLCPFCPHRSSRKCNMQVHIQRWYGGNKEPLYIGNQIETCLNTRKSSVPATENGQTVLNDNDLIDFINLGFTLIIQKTEQI
jgi:hypothetical protein